MPKKILFESSVHQFLSAAREFAEAERVNSVENYQRWSRFILSMIEEECYNVNLLTGNIKHFKLFA